MKKYEEAYQAVEAIRREQPELPTRELIRRAGCNQSAYYLGKRNAEGPATRKKYRRGPRLAQTLNIEHSGPTAPVARTPSAQERQVAMFVGSPEQLMHILGSIL